RRELLFGLVARGKIQECARRRIEAMAFGELRTSLGVLAALHELPPLPIERLGERVFGAPALRRGGCGERLRSCPRQKGQKRRRSPHSGSKRPGPGYQGWQRLR